MKNLIIIADDFGIICAVSNAVIEAIMNGSLSGATLMVNMPGADYAIDLTMKNLGLGP